MRRAIQRLIQDPLALKLLNGDFVEGETILVDAGRRVRRELEFIERRCEGRASLRPEPDGSYTTMNALKTVLLLGLLSGLLLVGGEAIAGRNGLYMGLGLAVVMNFASYFFSDKIALAMYRRPAGDARPKIPEVYRRVAPIVQQPGAAHGPAHAEALRHSGRIAQRLRHRPQPDARFGGVHRRHSATDER